MIQRSNSFFESRYVGAVVPLSRSGDYIMDNRNHIVAALDHHVIPTATRYLPYRVGGRAEDAAIVFRGRVYGLRQVCSELEGWNSIEGVDHFVESVFVDLLVALFTKSYAWDLDFTFPCVGCLYQNALNSGNVIDFITQFSSDPFEPEVLDGDDNTLETCSLSSLPSLDLNDIVGDFDWEFNMDIFDE